MTPPPVKAEAERHGIPVLQPEKVRLEEEIEKVLSLKPDMIVTAAFGQILPKQLLDGFRNTAVSTYTRHYCLN